MDPCHPQGRIQNRCAISVLIISRKDKHILMFSQLNSAPEELTLTPLPTTCVLVYPWLN